MWKLISSILLVFISFEFSAGQDWSLFPLNKKLYYEFVDYSGRNIDEINCDSIVNQGGLQLILNRSKINNEFIGNCQNVLLQYQYAFNQNDFIATLIQNSDTIFYLSKFYSQNMFFLPGSQPGVSWSFTSYTQITITCSAFGIDTILGIPDSVKIFTMHESPFGSTDPVDNHTIILSKHFGFIRFIPFEEFFYHTSNSSYTEYNLAGLADSSQSIGFTPPFFTDYFPCQAGDVLLWNTHYDNGWNISGTDYDEYHLDSITSVFISQDSIVYTYDSWYLNRYGQSFFTAGLTNRYYETRFGSLFSAPPFSLAFNDDSPGIFNIWETDGIKLKDDTVLGNDMVERKYFTRGDRLDSSSCSILTAIDYGYHIIFNNHLGMIEECDFLNSMSTLCTKLIAASLNGHVYGNLQFPVSIPIPPSAEKISVFPLPAWDKVLFNLPSDKKISVAIYNELGKQVMVLDEYVSESFIDISTLSPGIYFVKLGDDKIQLHSTIVISR